MKNQQGIVWAPILIMVGVLLVAGVASFMLFRAGQTSNENVNVAVVNQADNNDNTNSAVNLNQATNTNVGVNTNTTANTNTAGNTNTTTDPTAGWKTYTNTKYGFSLKYPQGQDMGGNEFNAPIASASNVFVTGYLVNNVRQSALFNVEVANSRYSDPNDPDLKLTLKDFAAKIWSLNKNDQNPNYPNKQVGPLVSSTIDGQQAYSFTLTSSFQDYASGNPGEGYALSEQHSYYITEYNGKKFVLWHPTASENSKMILSTFTFTK